MKNVVGKTFRTVGLDGKKCRWVVEQNLELQFMGQFYMAFLRFFSGLYCLTESCLFRFGLKDLFPLHALDIKVVFDR